MATTKRIAKPAGTKAKTTTKAKAPTTSKAPAKTAAPKETTATKSNRRSDEELKALVPQFVEHLQNGGKMKELKAEHNFSSDHPIRVAMAREGFDAKGNAVEYPNITGTGAALAKKIEAERQAGVGIYLLAIRTGKTETEVKAFLVEHGYDPSGRVYKAPAPKPTKTTKAKATPKTKAAKAKEAEADPSDQA